MIGVSGLSVTLGGRHVLADLSTQFTRGKITAILGPNGAGKTTLLRAILGLVAHSGEIALDGTPVNTLPRQSRAQRIGYLAQMSAPSWNLRARDVVMLGRAPHRHPTAAPSPADFAAVTEAMTSTDTLGFADRFINDLSGGERARVLLARVLATQPDWLLIDEPLNHLDPLHQRNMLRLMRAQAARGAGVIVVLHDLNAAAHIADDVLLLREGAVVAKGKATEVLTAVHLRTAYDMDFEFAHSAASKLSIGPLAD